MKRAEYDELRRNRPDLDLCEFRQLLSFQQTIVEGLTEAELVSEFLACRFIRGHVVWSDFYRYQAGLVP